MTENGRHSQTERAASAARDDNGRVFGWVSGLGLLVLPWFVAGFVATAATMVGPSGWTAERVFPWAMLAGIVLGLAWVVIGSVRISHFARGAVPGAAISLGVLGGIYLLSLLL